MDDEQLTTDDFGLWTTVVRGRHIVAWGVQVVENRAIERSPSYTPLCRSYLLESALSLDHFWGPAIPPLSRNSES
ncbi:MAG TPA: hypothetical protein VJ183_18190 [Chloroflexia bacterium]|nr:hypothetical protein [Chloroflexia bacterium]